MISCKVMATPLYDHKLSGAKFKNWIKAGLGVLYTKEGIEPFVYNEIEQFQQKCLSDICNNNGLVAGTTCSSCCTENVVVCPTNRICNAGRGKCKFHRNSATQYLPSGCPNKICHNLKIEIQKAHRFYGPSYKNTDARHWCNNPWDVAKCFMPPDGYKDVTSAAETDFNGIISVIINYKAFQSKIHDDLSKTYSFFEQGRELGKDVRHSPQLEMEDTDLKQYFTVLQHLLSDPTYLSSDTAAKNAKTKLLQLQNDTLVIGKDDVRKVLDDVAKAVQDKIRTNLKEAEKKKIELINVMNESVKAIDNEKNVSIAQLEKAFKSAIDELERQTKESLTKVQSEAYIATKQIEEGTDKGVNKLEVKAEAGVKQIEESADKGVNKLEVGAKARLKQIEESADRGVNKLEVKAEAGVKQIEESADKGVNKLEDEAKSGVKQIEESADKGNNKLEVGAKAGVKQIEDSADKGINKLEVEVKAGMKQIEEYADKRVNKMEVEAEAGVNKIEESTNKGVNKLEVEAEAGITKISAKTDEALKQIEESTNKEDKYNKLKEGKCIFFKTSFRKL
ncbi:uncharacterized protein LOC123565918 [Mercenaria mercenaria]|uniref:uncharacterized protein LOC123565918 n=1 Tax=Mercenaria mercenaria TaxID=6596 RepID=UPI00234F39FB|nr:uncharacterized protein LOC123565918 [Mercenaria mercenaria]XP_053400384.1 uncharacterized protein LOC123565918 [Mercenaria mercenaria]